MKDILKGPVRSFARVQSTGAVNSPGWLCRLLNTGAILVATLVIGSSLLCCGCEDDDDNTGSAGESDTAVDVGDSTGGGDDGAVSSNSNDAADGDSSTSTSTDADGSDSGVVSVPSTPSTPSTPSAFQTRVAAYKASYGMSDEWEAWMAANQSRYSQAFAASVSRPGSVTVSFTYDSLPIAYDPAWASEDEHMGVLAAMANGAYPGYNFNIVFGSAGGAYAVIVAGIPSNNSYASGNHVYLYYETIFNHEFAHVMKIPHHYDTVGAVGAGQHMPPGETRCIMDRNSSVFCSACATALGLPLNGSNAGAVDSAMNNIFGRYPY